MTTDTWRSRGYIPHWEVGASPQALTFRLADSLPSAVLDRWQNELKYLPADGQHLERRKRIETALDRGHGEALLLDQSVAEIVERALLHFNGDRYDLHAWCIMPNHVHVVATPRDHWTLADILHSWKPFTAIQINKLLNRSGTLWAREYFDRAIRDEDHFVNAVTYVEMNPVKAGLCASPKDWRFSSAWHAWERRPLTSS